MMLLLLLLLLLFSLLFVVASVAVLVVLLLGVLVLCCLSTLSLCQLLCLLCSCACHSCSDLVFLGVFGGGGGICSVVLRLCFLVMSFCLCGVVAVDVDADVVFQTLTFQGARFHVNNVRTYTVCKAYISVIFSNPARPDPHPVHPMADSG